MRMPSANRRRLTPLAALTTAGLLAAAPAAIAAPAAKAPAAKTFTGTVTPNPTRVSDETGSKRTISFQLSGTTVSKLTIGAGTATCKGLDDDGITPITPFTVKTKQLTLPTLTLKHGTYTAAAGMTINAEFVRPGGSGGFKVAKSALFDEAGYTVDLIANSNVKRTAFGSNINGQSLGLAAVFHMNSAGQINVNNHIRCSFGGNVTLKVKK